MKNTIIFLILLTIFYFSIGKIFAIADELWEDRAKKAGYYCDDWSMVNPKDYGYCSNLRAEGLKK